MRKIFPLLFILCLATVAQATEIKILEQIGAPLRISSYSANYKSPARGIGDGSIVHRFVVENIGEQDVVAYGVGIQVFDAFKRSMDLPFVGYDMSGIKVGSTQDPVWERRSLSAYLFRRYGTAVAYIDIARFADGTIWKANQGSISAQITDLQLEMSEE
ncbi:MAG: hypothetical protein P1U75_04920 [Antarcticimicrobium sp.]|uniref:hypothetical protein n=1 Tax=Antarcticimicrobium sp. TaxID=2824147 RepID=UPI002618DCBD|nr:hypothetical protein [Antarcticimicrobium sp.]MDF1716003.1 hypothetical protein [Antarcticimicrobium sp.]